MPSTLIFVSAAMLFGGDDPLVHSVSFGSCRIGVHYLLVYLRRAWSFHSTYYCRRDDASQRRGQIHKRDLCGATTIQTYDSQRLALLTSGVGGNRTLDKWNYDCDASPFFGFQPYSVVYDFGSAFTGKILAIACMVAILVAFMSKLRQKRVANQWDKSWDMLEAKNIKF